MNLAVQGNQQVEEVYVLLKKNYRISRNIRLIWFFNNVLKDITTLPKVCSKDGIIDESDGNEIRVLSWSRKENGDVMPEGELAQENRSDVPCTLQLDTNAYFLSSGYRLVFALDLSPSLFRVSTQSHQIVAEQLLSKLAECLCCLVELFQVPNSDVNLKPNIYVTVFAQVRRSHRAEGRYKQDIIVQGCLLTPSSIVNILKSVECKIYHEHKERNDSCSTQFSSSARHDHGLVSMLRTGLLALQLLPANTSAGIVVVTDGVVGVPDMAVLETLINQLRTSTTSCSVLHLMTPQSVFCNYAFCPSTELLKFISAATYGAFFDSYGNYGRSKGENMNAYQKGLLIWQFQLNEEVNGLPESLDVRKWEPEADLRYTPKQKNMYIAPVLRKKQFEKTLRVNLFSVLSVRLREGYMISSMSFGKDGDQLEINLVYPWNHSASVKYVATSSWPVSRNQTKIEVFIEGTYEFLSDITSGVRQENSSRQRVIVFRRFTHFMKGLSQTDHMLTHLLSFTSDPVHYRVGQKQVPLFYLPPNSSQLVLSNENDSSKMFAAYWKPILSLDTSIWQKWMHTHHIDIILQHDIPLPKHLHAPSKSGRFHSIQTSTAMSQLASLLREWCTFVLLENHSYIKFMYKENEDRPSSFFVVRLSNKAPVVVIRLAFLIGAPGQYRNKVLSELRDRVLSLSSQTISKQLLPLSSRPSGLRSRHSSAQSNRRYLSGSERPCVVLYHKPLDRVLIRYDQAPRDFLRPPVSSHRRAKGVNSASSKSETVAVTGGTVGSNSMMLDPCRYLEHHRSVWSVTNHSLTPLLHPIVGQMASLLVKLRLFEGFSFASTSSGVITMAKEFTVTADECDGTRDNTHECLCQYVLFPPTTCTSRERRYSFTPDGSGDEEEDGAEADGELFLSAETWMEPQCGIVVKGSDSGQDSRPPSRLAESGRSSKFNSVSSSTTTYSSQPIQRFIGSTYDEIASVVASEDKVLICVLVTIEHLRLMCIPKSTVLDTLPQQGHKVNSEMNQKLRSQKQDLQPDGDRCNTPSEDIHPSYEGITHTPCLFDLISLLDRCPRTKLLFMTLSQGSDEGNMSSPNDCLFEFFQKSLEKISDREALLSDDDCYSITEHMQKREKLLDGATDESEEKKSSKWKCYLRMLSHAKVMVILLPASFEDLKKLSLCIPGFDDVKLDPAESVANIQEPIPENAVVAEIGTVISPEPDEEPDEQIANFSEKTLFGREEPRLSRRRSIKRMLSRRFSDEQKKFLDALDMETDGKQVSNGLPVFVYECSTSSVVDLLVKEPNLSPEWSDLDAEIDYRIKPVDNRTDFDASKLRFFRSQSCPFQSYQRLESPTEEFVSSPCEEVFGSAAASQRDSDLETASLHESLVDCYHRCFVTAVSNNLRRDDGRNVARVDIQAATDVICGESVQEIDITQFLLITSPQVAAFKNQHLSQEILDQRDNDNVFSLVGPQFHAQPPIDRKIRHTSSTSSNTDSSSKHSLAQKRSTTVSPDQTTRGSKDQVSGICVKREKEDDTVTGTIEGKHITTSDKSTAKQASRSAFKKLRRRPHSLPKSTAPAKEKCDTDGDTPEADVPAFFPVQPASSNASSTRATPSTEHSSLPRSLMVEKPIAKLPVASKVEWADLPEFPISLLKQSHPRHISGNDDQVQMSFCNLISQNFHPIQTMPDVFYYKPPESVPSTPLDSQEKNLTQFEGRQAVSKEESGTVIGADDESDQDVKFELSESESAATARQIVHDGYETMSSDMEKVNEPVKRKVTKRRKRVLSDLEGSDEDFDRSSRSGSSMTSGDFSEDYRDSEDEKDTPLFLCMTCTVRDKKTGNHGSMVVEGLPTSLHSVLDTLENECDTIDLSQLSVTLDLIWIVLRAEVKKTDRLSDSESRFSSGLVQEEEDSPRHESSISKERNHTLQEEQETVDPLSALPSLCLKAVNSTKGNIDWLLKDEIISALRTCETIDVSTLERVTRHVEESHTENCMVETTNLQFVFGAEKSFQLFNTLFEKMFKDFKGYRMKKEGDFYYFTTERTFLPIQNWRGDQFQEGNGSFDQRNMNDVVSQPFIESASSAATLFVEGKKDQANLENSPTPKNKTLQDCLQSPPSKLTALTKSHSSLVRSEHSIHSSLSFHSLPDNEMMSVEAIESDVGGGIEMSVRKRASSSRSTPIRKTSSALDVVSPAVSSPGCNDAASPCIQSKGSQSDLKSRRSLPTVATQSSCLFSCEKSGKKKLPIKQRSVESNLNMSGKIKLKRHSGSAAAPISSWNSQSQRSGPTSPLVVKQSYNSSSGSIGSAPMSRRRSMNSATPVSQLAQQEVISISSEPSTSTPLVKVDNANGKERGVPTTLTNTVYLKDSAGSPVSNSDSDIRRFSTASWIESGYDGEESDMDAEDGYSRSLDDANDLPSFWLIVHVLHDILKMFFHRRNSSTVSEMIMAEQKRVFDTVKKYVDITCKRVNQTLLLLELHDSRMCNALLVEETEEDIWRQDYQYANYGISDEHVDGADRALLAATMTTAPGQFACDCVLERRIKLHPRLKSAGNVTGKSSVIATVQDLVINLMVSNRKNMFVYQLTDKSVFYCRMEEDGIASNPAKADSRRSSQLYQTPTPSLEAGSDLSDRRPSRESLASFGQLDPSKYCGTLLLKWHGVGPLSPHQEGELNKMNESIEKRLNDSILEKITVVLQRNSKLTSSDVQFIQPSVQTPSISGSPIVSKVRPVCPNDTLSYGLPDEFGGSLAAVKYYLHQNLLQFMALPRYADATQPSGQFVPHRMKTPPSESVLKTASSHLSDGCVFLFHQSSKPGKTGYGIACVVLEITDAEGNQISTDTNPKFIHGQSTVDHLVNLTEVIDSQEVVSNAGTSRSNTPATLEQNPPAILQQLSSPVKNYVRFHLWLKGSLTLSHLNEKLRPAVRHALFDVITELVILNPTLCDSESQEKQDGDVVGSMELQKSKNSTSGKTDAMRSLFSSLNDPNSSIGRGILTNLLHPKLDLNSKEESTSKTTAIVRKGPGLPDRRKSAGVQREVGDEGSLREVYKDSSKIWFDAMEKNGCPSVFKVSLHLSNMSHLDNLLQDVKKILKCSLAECQVRIFSSNHSESKASVVDFSATERRKGMPARYARYIIVARNSQLWHKSTGSNLQATATHPGVATAKFAPHDSSLKPEQSPRTQDHRFSSFNVGYIPRQQFLLIDIQHRQLNVFGYNVSNEIVGSLNTKLLNCVNFHNGRWRASDCLTFQKLGLFRHCAFETGYPTRDMDRKGHNSFTQDIKDVDVVLAYSKVPTESEIQSQRRSKSNRRAFFSEAYVANIPVRPLNASKYKNDRDTVTQYAKQYLEMKANLKKRNEEQQHMLRVYTNWRERPTSTSNTALTKDILQAILPHTRLIHHVTSPILFSPYIRKEISRLKDLESSSDVVGAKDAAISKRQERMPGTIRRSGDFTGKIIEEKPRSRSNSARKESLKDKGSKHSLSEMSSESPEGSRYDLDELRRALVSQYVQYWQSMHFILIKEDKRSKNEKMREKKFQSTDRAGTKQERNRTLMDNTSSSSYTGSGSFDKAAEANQPLYLYRVSPGGIILVEVAFVGMNFSVKLHVIEYTRLQNQSSLNQQMNVLFLNECEQLKNLTHVRSFMYDFHLRYVQMYIQERQTAIKQGYHLVSLLRDFMDYYKHLPSCTFNQIHQGVIEAPCTHVAAGELYEYLVGKQAAHFKFRTLKLVSDNNDKSKHALVSSRLVIDETHVPPCSEEEHNIYDIGYVIWHNSDEQVLDKKIQLSYFLLFTNRRHLFPRLDRFENRPTAIFPTRRGSANVLSKSSGLEKKSNDEILSPTHSARRTAVMKQQRVSPTSRSTSSLPKLEKEVTSPPEVAEKSIRLSPTMTKKFAREINPSLNPSFMSTEFLNSPATSKPEEVFTPPAPASIMKKRLSYGRRQSTPSVGGIPAGILQSQTTSSPISQEHCPDEHRIKALGSPFVQCETRRLKDYLLNICELSDKECYRNQLWDKVYMDRSNKASGLSIKDFEHLLKHCQMVPITKLDPRGRDLCDTTTMGLQWALKLQRHMVAKFDKMCRCFENSEGSKIYLGVLNPKLYQMMFLITVDTEAKKIVMEIVMRDELAELDKDEPDLTTGNAAFIPLLGHVNDMIGFICYHTWSALLSP